MSSLFGINKEKKLTVIKFLGIKIKIRHKEKIQAAVMKLHRLMPVVSF